MFIYNTTFVINKVKFTEWETWLRGTYIPLIKNVIVACEVGVYEVMTIENPDERTISVQSKVATPSDLEVINDQSPILLGQMSSNFGQDALFFSTILKEI